MHKVAIDNVAKPEPSKRSNGSVNTCTEVRKDGVSNKNKNNGIAAN